MITYSSRVLTGPEKNYSIAEKEALAVLNGIKQFTHYLQGHHFVICTDHAALKWLMSIKEPTGRLARWALTIQQFSFTIKHRSGKTHGNADALSRRPIFPTIAAIKTVQNSGFQKDYIQTLQHQDERLADLIAYLKSDQLPPNNKVARSFLLTVNDYFLEKDILYHLWTLTGRKKKGPFVQSVVPKGLQLQIMQAAHDDVLAGHLGEAKT